MMKATDINIDKDDTILYIKMEGEDYYRMYYSKAELIRLIDEACSENDLRVGRMTRELEMERDTNARRREWLQKQKKRAGVLDSASFDDVWEEALQALIHCRRNEIDYHYSDGNN